MNKPALVAALTAWMLACGSSSRVTEPTGPPAPTPPHGGGSLHVQFTINGEQAGSFSCARGMFLETSAHNAGSQPLELTALEVRFERTIGNCGHQAADIDPRLTLRIEPGQSAQVRRFDAAGQLCEPPAGSPDCGWNATARVTTASGVAAEGHVAFTTHLASADCDGVVPAVISPQDGDVLTGQVRVVGSVRESRSCVTSARGIVEGYAEGGQRVFTTPAQDLGDSWRWDTTRFPNGRYLLAAYQNCCRIRSIPIVVSVRN